ncbi:MAG: hypothetical protein P8I55_06980 [Crocinitomix sp.]|nr:hypothetical protein [Crocinitomix sp.]
MKKSILLITIVCSFFSLYGQDKKAIKEQQKALQNLEQRIPFPALDVIDNSGKLLYKNQPLTVEFKEVSASYTAKIETLEPYFVSTLYPLFNV